MSTPLSYPPALLNEEDAAAYLARISTRTLARLQADSLIVPKALGNRRVYARADLDAFAISLPDWDARKSA